MTSSTATVARSGTTQRRRAGTGSACVGDEFIKRADRLSCAMIRFLCCFQARPESVSPTRERGVRPRPSLARRANRVDAITSCGPSCRSSWCCPVAADGCGATASRPWPLRYGCRCRSWIRSVDCSSTRLPLLLVPLFACPLLDWLAAVVVLEPLFEALLVPVPPDDFDVVAGLRAGCRGHGGRLATAAFRRCIGLLFHRPSDRLCLSRRCRSCRRPPSCPWSGSCRSTWRLSPDFLWLPRLAWPPMMLIVMLMIVTFPLLSVLPLGAWSSCSYRACRRPRSGLTANLARGAALRRGCRCSSKPPLPESPEAAWTDFRHAARQATLVGDGDGACGDDAGDGDARSIR